MHSVLRQKRLIAEQVSDLEGAIVSARCQLDSRVALGNEMKALLEQRAAQIKHLQRNKLSIAMETDLLNMSRESLVTGTNHLIMACIYTRRISGWLKSSTMTIHIVCFFISGHG